MCDLATMWECQRACAQLEGHVDGTAMSSSQADIARGISIDSYSDVRSVSIAIAPYQEVSVLGQDYDQCQPHRQTPVKSPVIADRLAGADLRRTSIDRREW